MGFIERIKELIKKNHITSNKMLMDLGLAKGSMYSWQMRGTIPNAETMSKIADYFGVTVDYLVNGTTTPVSDVVMVPIYGNVAAGEGMFADNEIIGIQPVFSAMVKNIGECFCLRVSGDSMLPLIQDGSTILVRKQSSVDSGTYAVVLIDDNNGVVKKVIYDADSVTLVSINPNYPPRTFAGEDLKRLIVLGSVVQIITTIN